MNRPVTFSDEQKAEIYKLSFCYIHQESRQRVIKSHLKHEKYFQSFNAIEFNQYIVNRYLEYWLEDKRFSIKFFKGVIESIMRHRNITNYNSSNIYKIVANLNKIVNPENKDNAFYTNTGERVVLDIKNMKSIKNDLHLSAATGTILPYKQDDNKNFKANQFSQKLYSEESFELIKTYYKTHMDNFLMNSKMPATIHDELALLILFLITSAKRSIEVLRLTVNKVNDLILTNQTDVKSKTGTSVDTLVIPFQFATILERYLEHINPIDGSQKLFSFGYNKLYACYKKNLKFILGDNVPVDDYRRLAFHSFRHYFANKHYDTNANMTMQLMSHKSKKMTRSYASKQQAKSTVGDMKKFMKDNYPL